MVIPPPDFVMTAPFFFQPAEDHAFRRKGGAGQAAGKNKTE